MYINWYHDAFLVVDLWSPGDPWTSDLNHWVPHVEYEGWMATHGFSYCFPGHWEARRKKKPDQQRIEDIVLGIRNLFV